MDTFSFSRLSLYQTCPYRFYKKYVQGYEEPTTFPLALGKAVHKSIQDRLNDISLQEALMNGFIEADFHPNVTKKELSWLTKSAPIFQVRGEVELHFKIPLSNEEKAPELQGFIDVVSNDQIIDWKTNRKTYHVRDSHQLALYAWVISQLRGFSKVYGSLFFLRFKKVSGFLFGPNEMENARSWAYEMAKEIQCKLSLLKVMPELKDGLFPDTPSSYCAHCPLAIECFRKYSTTANIL